jgi:hypothetical protein
MRAQSSHLCPVCNRYITRGSRVWRLSVPLAPQRPYYRRDKRIGTVRDIRPRWIVHERCGKTGERLIGKQATR